MTRVSRGTVGSGRVAGDRPLPRGPGWVAVVAVAALVGTACTSSSKSGSPATRPSGTTARGTPLVAAWVGNGLTGPDNEAGIAAAVKAVNASGGVDGHPIKVTTCLDNNDAATAVGCARTAIADKATLAFTDVGSSYGDSFDPLITQANMANIGNLALLPADASAPSTFILTNGFGAEIPLVQLGYKKIGVPYIGVPAGAELPPLITSLVKPLGGTVVGVESIPPTATDYTAFAAKEIVAKPDIVVDGLTSSMYETFIKAVEAQGGDLTYEVSTAVFDAAQVQQSFGNAVHVILEDEYNHESPGYTRFMSDMAMYNPSYPNRNDSVVSGWIAVEAFAQVIKALIAKGDTTPTRAEIVDYLNRQTDFDVQGLTGGINYTKPFTGLGGTFPRYVFNRVWVANVVNGKEVYVNGGKPFNPTGAGGSS